MENCCENVWTTTGFCDSVATSDVLTSDLMFSEKYLMSEVLVTNLMLAGLLLLFPTFSILLRQKQVGFAIVNFLSSVL